MGMKMLFPVALCLALFHVALGEQAANELVDKIFRDMGPEMKRVGFLPLPVYPFAFRMKIHGLIIRKLSASLVQGSIFDLHQVSRLGDCRNSSFGIDSRISCRIALIDSGIEFRTQFDVMDNEDHDDFHDIELRSLVKSGQIFVEFQGAKNHSAKLTTLLVRPITLRSDIASSDLALDQLSFQDFQDAVHENLIKQLTTVFRERYSKLLKRHAQRYKMV